MKKINSLGCICLFFIQILIAQPERWQQQVKYAMDIQLNPATHQFSGKQTIVYDNNSTDTLTHLFFHLYLNAFQRGSVMDVRSHWLPDPQRNMDEKFAALTPEQEGWQRISQLRVNGQNVTFHTEGTILEVTLATPIAPRSSSKIEMEYTAQVPIQIRRNGRDSEEGIDYSMAQWYPKLCEYDYQGWHANPYVAREFYGVWGDFDVKITLPKNYIVAAGGILQNPQAVGNGYEDPAQPLTLPTGDLRTYHFVAKNVHDFTWAADRDYIHKKHTTQAGTELHFFYQPGEATQAWEQLPTIMDAAQTYMNRTFGKYAYPVYYFVQGGDGGMEYPMITLITGNRPLVSLVGVSVHEWMHSWYQMMLGTNEALYAWMDEGFTSYGSDLVMNELARQQLLPANLYQENPLLDNYKGYTNLVLSGKEEPLTTHADHFATNFAYSLAAYVKGSVFLSQLEYIIGKENFDSGLLRYFDVWKFKHPNVNDCVREFEKQSKLELDWYKEYWVHTTHFVDYSVDSVYQEGKNTIVRIARLGSMPMPLDIQITADGKVSNYYIPLDLLRGEKPAATPRTVLPDWQWTNTTYDIILPIASKKLERIVIDPSRMMADIDLENNIYPQPPPTTHEQQK